METKASLIRQIGGRFETARVEIAEPVGREVLVDVRASSLCHSDYGSANDDWGFPLPWIGGHEFAGVVLAIGPDVRDVEVGQHVVGCLVQFCGDCEACRDDRTFQCPNGAATMRAEGEPARVVEDGESPVGQFVGLGGFAGRVLAHENQVIAVPEQIPFASASLLGCGALTGAGAILNAAKLPKGATVLIIGAGGVGLHAVQAARIAGAGRIIVADRIANKLDLATSLGATDVIDSSAGDLVEAVRGLTDGRGVDFAFEFVGRADTTRLAITATRVGGQVFLIGVHKLGIPDEIFVTQDLLMAQRSLTGVFMGSSNSKQFIPRLAEMYLAGDYALDDLVSSTIGIDDVADAYDQLLRGEIARAVITDFR